MMQTNAIQQKRSETLEGQGEGTPPRGTGRKNREWTVQELPTSVVRRAPR